MQSTVIYVKEKKRDSAENSSDCTIESAAYLLGYLIKQKALDHTFKTESVTVQKILSQYPRCIVCNHLC